MTHEISFEQALKFLQVLDITPDNAIVCPNCNYAYRNIDEQGFVEPCPNCDDDEWNIYEYEVAMEDI